MYTGAVCNGQFSHALTKQFCRQHVRTHKYQKTGENKNLYTLLPRYTGIAITRSRRRSRSCYQKTRSRRRSRSCYQKTRSRRRSRSCYQKTRSRSRNRSRNCYLKHGGWSRSCYLIPGAGAGFVAYS